MTKERFIEHIAKYIIKYAPEYGIKVHSPIIAQAVLESAAGTSELARVNNYFGLKYRANRCPSSNGTYKKVAYEQNEDGSYSQYDNSLWFKFPDMESGVKGYFEFINISNYANLKGITDPQKYLETIKADKYATSLDYVSKLMKVINTYNLTQYDEVDKKMVINVHAGHNPDGKVGCGAVGLIKESTEARAVKNLVINKLQSLGHTVYDCTVDNGKSQSDVLQQIVKKCNAHKADLDISIHFNAGGGTGTEVLVYSSKSGCLVEAKNIVNCISSLGFKNRGVKYRTDLYVLKKTTAPALLIECCYVDNKDDVNLYNAEKMAVAIVRGITGQTVTSSNVSTLQSVSGAFKIKVKVDELNIRAGAGTNYVVVGKITKDGVYTITKTSGNWGFLKSGIGWINISSAYVTRV